MLWDDTTREFSVNQINCFKGTVTLRTILNPEMVNIHTLQNTPKPFGHHTSVSISVKSDWSPSSPPNKRSDQPESTPIQSCLEDTFCFRFLFLDNFLWCFLNSNVNVRNSQMIPELKEEKEWLTTSIQTLCERVVENLKDHIIGKRKGMPQNGWFFHSQVGDVT